MDATTNFKTIKQVASQLSVHRNTVHNMIADGTLQTIRVRNRTRIDLDSYLNALTGKPQCQSPKQ